MDICSHIPGELTRQQGAATNPPLYRMRWGVKAEMRSALTGEQRRCQEQLFLIPRQVNNQWPSESGPGIQEGLMPEKMWHSTGKSGHGVSYIRQKQTGPRWRSSILWTITSDLQGNMSILLYCVESWITELIQLGSIKYIKLRLSGSILLFVDGVTCCEVFCVLCNIIQNNYNNSGIVTEYS